MKVFKTGDHVIFKRPMSETYISGYISEVLLKGFNKIKKRLYYYRVTYIIELKEYTILLDDNFIELDVQYYRDKKLEELGI